MALKKVASMEVEQWRTGLTRGGGATLPARASPNVKTDPGSKEKIFLEKKKSKIPDCKGKIEKKTMLGYKLDNVNMFNNICIDLVILVAGE